MHRDDRAKQIKKAKLYAQSMLSDAIRIGGINEALSVRMDLSTTLEASMYDANIISALRRSDSSNIKHVLYALKGTSEALINVLNVMIDNKDVYLLVRVCDQYEALLQETFDVVVVDVITAVELDDNLRKIIEDKCQNDLDSNVLLHEHVDKDIVGGVILSALGRTIDMSVSSLLNNVKTELTSLHQVSE